MTQFKLRAATDKDIDFLWDMLYEAIYVPEGQTPPSRDILNEPSVKRSLSGWGRNGDKAIIAENAEHQPIGAVWLRLFDDENKTYVYIDQETPLLGIALLPQYRGKGVGSLLLEKIMNDAKSAGVQRISLSVDPNNPARRLYERFGFKKIGIDGTSWDMVATI